LQALFLRKLVLKTEREGDSLRLLSRRFHFLSQYGKKELEKRVVMFAGKLLAKNVKYLGVMLFLIL